MVDCIQSNGCMKVSKVEKFYRRTARAVAVGSPERSIGRLRKKEIILSRLLVARVRLAKSVWSAFGCGLGVWLLSIGNYRMISTGAVDK